METGLKPMEDLNIYIFGKTDFNDYQAGLGLRYEF